MLLGGSNGQTIEISRRRGTKFENAKLVWQATLFLFARNSLSSRLVEWGKCIKELAAPNLL